MLRRRTTLPRGSRLAVVAALALLGAFQSPRATGAAEPRAASEVATYRVRIDPGSPRVVVTATLPAADSVLSMDESRPVGVPELDSLGWAGLVRGMRVSDTSGQAIGVARDGARGWRLARPATGAIRLDYEVDYTPLQRLDWPAPREAAYRDDDTFLVVGRSLFVTSAATSACRVVFELAAGWRASTPWAAGAGRETYVAGTPNELVENLVVLSTAPREDVTVDGFHLHVHALGPWRARLPEIRRILQPVVRHHVTMMRARGTRHYVLAFLPQSETGAESYRGSFALNADSVADPAATATWSNLVAHEMFHLWNGWMLRGADYMRTQWFQEGFTEYVANVAVARSGQVGADWLRGKLARHVENSRRLATTLEEIGSRKGQPLYSAGALVAFAWDVRIREASKGRRDLGDFLRALMRSTDGGKRAYAWADLRASLQATAADDWETFYQAHIRGHERLPIEQALATVGQQLVELPGGNVRVEPDPAAPEAARQRWTGLVRTP